MAKYIRFGGIPKDETSFAWNIEGNIKGAEPGVSVYDAVLLGDGKYHIVLPLPITEQMLNTFYSLINYQKRQVYLVEGTEVGRGSDNEPCLKNIKIVENITDDFKKKINDYLS